MVIPKKLKNKKKSAIDENLANRRHGSKKRDFCQEGENLVNRRLLPFQRFILQAHLLALSCFRFHALAFAFSLMYPWTTSISRLRGQHPIVLSSLFATITSCSSCVCLLSLSVTYLEILLIGSLMRQSPAVLAVSVCCRRCHSDSPHRICFATVTSRSDCVCLLLLVLRFRVLSMDLFSVSHQLF